MGKTVHLPVSCSTKECSHFQTCCRLPSSVYYNAQDGVEVLIIGQGAGWTEERDKKPWVGKAGELLRNILRDIKQEHIYDYGICLTNTVRCRPTEIVDGKVTDRPPTRDELNHCLKYLYKDINDLHPRILLLMGGSTANAFNFEGSVTSLRGREQVVSVNGITYPAIITFHPAGVLRIPSMGRDLRRDTEKAFNLTREIK